MEINYIKLSLAIFIAVTLSTLTTDVIEVYFAKKAAEEIINVTVKELKRSTIELNKKINIPTLNINKEINELMNKRKERANKSLKKEIEKIQSIRAIRKTNNDTCKFWNDEYIKRKSEYNEVMKNSACKRAAND